MDTDIPFIDFKTGQFVVDRISGRDGRICGRKGTYVYVLRLSCGTRVARDVADIQFSRFGNK